MDCALDYSLRPHLEVVGQSLGFSAIRRHDARPDLTDNRLLAALIEAGCRAILPALEFVPLPQGLVLSAPGGPRSYAYFPTSGIVGLFNVLENGASTMLAIIGNRGLVNTSIFMGVGTSPHCAQVIVAGYAFRLNAAVLKKEFKHSVTVQRLLLRFMQALMTHVAQTAVCNRHHTIEKRLCRLVLLSLDRLPSNELHMTQEQIAIMLGVRREGVTESARHLQDAGLIHTQRGHITVLDRPKLQQRACECYAVVKREYDQLLTLRAATNPRSAISPASLARVLQVRGEEIRPA